MNLFDKFFTKYGYKFPKGYPDMKNEQDILLLESLLNEVLDEPSNLSEAALSKSDLSKPIEGYDDRGQKLLSIISNKQPLKLMDGSEAIIDIPKSKNFISALKSKNYDGLSGRNAITFITTDGDTLTLGSVKKTEEFGSSKGSGGGAEQTAVQESSQCLVNAVRYIKGSDITSKDLTPKALKSAYNSTDTTSGLEEMSNFILNNLEWQNSMIQTANLLAKTFTKSYIFYRQKGIVLNIESAAKTALKNADIGANINKWNPADIWMATEKVSSIEFPTELNALNALIKKLFDSQDLIGVSLKKVSGAAHAEISGGGAGKTYTYEDYIVSPASKDIYLVYNDGRIQWRSFDNLKAYQGEVLGASAKHGKVTHSVANKFVQEAGLPMLANPNDVKEEVLSGSKTFQKKFAQLYKTYTGEDLNKIYDEKTDDWKFSKYLGLNLVDTLDGASSKQQNSVINNMINYAKSSSSFSSTYVKIS